MLLLREPSMLLLESLRWRLLRMSPLELRVVREFLMALRLGLYLSPVLVLRMRSKNGTEPFLGRPCTWVVKAGCEALRGMTDFGPNSLSGLSRLSLLSSSMAFLLRDLTDELLRCSKLPLLLVAPLDECSCTLTSDIVGRVGTVGTGVRGVPYIILVSINIIDAARTFYATSSDVIFIIYIW